VGGDLTLTGSINVNQDLTPLLSLEHVGGKLTIEDFNISSLNGLQNVQSLGSLTVHNNNYLGSVGALINATLASAGSVVITQNNPLTTCQANTLVNAFQQKGWNGTATVSGNQTCSQFQLISSSQLSLTTMERMP
jgi:hypothetical protein